MGHTLDSAARGRDCRRLAKSAELRSGSGNLYLRGGIRRLGRDLPLQRLAGEAPYATLLGPRLGAIPASGNRSQPGPRCVTRRDPYGGTALYRAPLAAALVDAPVPFL